MKKKKNIKGLLIGVGVTVLIGVIGALSTFFYVTRDTHLDAKAFENPTANLVLYDSHGEEINYASSLNVFTPYEDIGEQVRKSFVAVEDKRFFKHNGLDYYRLAGAVIHDIKAGYIKEGGSTITQQLAKNALLSNEKTLNRKMKEAKLAKQIEKNYSKEEILTMYLNTIYFGRGIYGITSASKLLFDKTPAEISLPEAAMLTGIVRSPQAYSPLNSPEKATERMRLALSVMRKEGYITEKEHQDAVNYEYVRPQRDYPNYSYQNAAIEEAGQLLNKSEKEILSNEYSVYTYMEPSVQNLADKASKSAEFMPNSACNYLALVADNTTGGVSGYSATFEYSVFSLKRMPGSVIKPIVAYAPALDAGYISPATPILDEKTDFGGYSPSNYGENYLGWTTVRKAVSTSSNVVSVKLVNQMGVDYVSYYAEQFGLDLSEDDGLSIALGGLKYGVSPVQMTSAYMTFANGGNYKNAVFVKEIKDKNGKTVYKHTPDENRVITRETAYLVTDMLMDTAKSGTARKLASLPFDIASKTGTVGVNGSDKNSDAWNMSYTSQNTVCVWYGSISNEPDTLLAKNITGGAYPTLVAKYMHRNLGNPTAFEIPDTIVPIEIDTYATENEHRLIVAGEYTPQKYKVWEVYDSKMELPEVSTYFDNAIPKDLKSNVTEDNKIEIYFSLNANFNYNLYKIGENGDTLLGNYSGLDEGTFLDETPELGVNSYYFTVTDTNGELIGESDRTSVLYFSVPDLLFSSRHPPTLLQ